MKNLQVVATLTIILLFSFCNTAKKSVSNGSLFSLHALLLEKTFMFEEKNDDFKYKVSDFIKSCKVLLKHREDSTSIYTDNNERGGPIILKPYLFNNDETEVIVMILTKSVDLADKPVDNIRFVLGRKFGGNWDFRPEQVSVRSFSYLENHPFLSDTEMSLQVLSTFISWGYINHNSLEIDDRYVTEYIKENWDR